MGFQREDNWEDVPGYREGVIFWEEVESNSLNIVCKAIFEGRVLEIRMNDFPDEPLYTLIADGVEVIHFNEWPVNWLR